MNKFLNKIDISSIKTLIATIVIIFSLLPTLFKNEGLFGLNRGYSVIWMVLLYLVGGGLRKLDLANEFSCKGLLKIYIVCVFITWLNKMLGEYICSYYGLKIDPISLISYISPTITISAISLVLLCSKIKIAGWKKKLVECFSPLSFSVYLIHDNPLVRRYLMLGRFAFCSTYSPEKLIIVVIGSASIIFLICSVIDAIRLQLFKLFNVNELSKNMVERLNKLLKNVLFLMTGEGGSNR